jgi:hypothetical protein
VPDVERRFELLINVERFFMSYRLYSGPHGAEAVGALDKDRLLFKEFASLDDALAFAVHLDRRGQVALLIDGDDGTSLARNEIAALIQQSRFRPSSPN